MKVMQRLQDDLDERGRECARRLSREHDPWLWPLRDVPGFFETRRAAVDLECAAVRRLGIDPMQPPVAAGLLTLLLALLAAPVLLLRAWRRRVLARPAADRP